MVLLFRVRPTINEIHLNLFFFFFCSLIYQRSTS